MGKVTTLTRLQQSELKRFDEKFPTKIYDEVDEDDGQDTDVKVTAFNDIGVNPKYIKAFLSSSIEKAYRLKEKEIFEEVKDFQTKVSDLDSGYKNKLDLICILDDVLYLLKQK